MYPISFEPSAFDGSLCSIASDWEARRRGKSRFTASSTRVEGKKEEINIYPSSFHSSAFFAALLPGFPFPPSLSLSPSPLPFPPPRLEWRPTSKTKMRRGAPRWETEKYFLFLPERGDFPLGGRSSLFPTPILLRRIPPSSYYSLFTLPLLCRNRPGEKEAGRGGPPFLFLLPLRSGESGKKEEKTR